MLLGQPVAVRDVGVAAADLHLRFAGVEGDAQVVAQEVAPPAVVIAADERDGDSPRARLLQLGDAREMLARHHGPVLEPEVEQVAIDEQMVAGLRDPVEECVERRLRGRRHLAQVGVRDHEAAGGCWHADKLRNWT